MSLQLSLQCEIESLQLDYYAKSRKRNTKGQW